MTEALPHRRKRNHGEHDQYVIEEAHPPIIRQEVFDQVQRLLDIKGSLIPPKLRGAYPFTQTLFCGTCGAIFKRKAACQTVYWMCSSHKESRENCPIQQIPESEIERAFLRLYYKLQHLPILT